MDCFTDEKWMKLIYVKKASLLFSCQVVSNSLQLHWLQHTRPSVPYPLPEFAQVHVHCIGDAIQPSHPLTSSSPSALNLSQHQGLFQWVICWPQMTKSWSFSIGPSSEYSVLIFLKIDWFDPLAVQGTLKSLQRHSSKASVLWLSVFFMVQLSHPYMTTGKTIALARWTFVDKMMFLLFNTLFRFV